VERCWLALFLFNLAPLDAQVDVGVTGGVPLTPFILNTSSGSRVSFSQVTSAPRRYTVGPYLEVHVHGPVGVETGALYKRFGFDTVSASNGGPLGPLTERVVSATTGNSWEFPILAKVHLRFLPRLNGFLSAGPSIRRLAGITEAGQRTMYPTCPPPCALQTVDYKTDSPIGLDRRTSVGAAFGAGLEFKIGTLRLDPGFRVTRWDSERTSSMSAASRLARTQAEVLLTVAHSVSGGPEAPPARIACCFEFGLLAGMPLLPASDVRPGGLGPNIAFQTPTPRYAVGALLDWRLDARWSLEASFLTRPFGHTEVFSFSNGVSKGSVSGYSWEVPLLLKWRVARIRSATLVIGAGPAILRASNLSGLYSAQSAPGATVSGGIELKTGRVRLRPEIRYDWFNRPLYDFYVVKSRQDSLFLTFGVSHASR
jgi:hypothetical protein